VSVKKMEEETYDKHHSSDAINLISADIARKIRLSRVYVAFCAIACVSVLALLLARILLFK
jgi:hypothetical protein